MKICKHCGEPIEYIKGSGWNHLGRGAVCHFWVGITNDEITWAEPAEKCSSKP